MRSRLLAHAAAMTFAVGGLLVIPASPASADCTHPNHPNDYIGGGIDYQRDGTAIKTGPHPGCPALVGAFPGQPIDVHCSRNEDGTQNDWVFLHNSLYDENGRGWAREHTLAVQGTVNVPQCASAGTLVIGDA